MHNNFFVVCDFEDVNICGYQQDIDDQFDWTRGSDGTSSGATGPNSDHTYGTPAGKEATNSFLSFYTSTFVRVFIS